MRTAQQGDQVQVHYMIRCEDGSGRSSRGGPPLELTVGFPHPRLPGLGLALVGLAPGERKTVRVAPDQGCGMPDPARVRRCSRKRFPEQAALQVGQWVRVADARGRHRMVRILQVDGRQVLVDTNHRWAGQTLELEVELIALAPPSERRPGTAKAVAFDLDQAGLASLRESLPGWAIETINGATPASIAPDWDPSAAGLLVVAVGADEAGTWGLCRFLAFQASFRGARPKGQAREASLPGTRLEPDRLADTALLVLVPAGREALISTALEAGAHRCLVLPLQPGAVASVLAHARAGNQPGRHTLNTEQAQRQDRWRDEGGEG